MPKNIGMNLLKLNNLRNNQAKLSLLNNNPPKNTLSLNMLSRLNNSASCGSCGK